MPRFIFELTLIVLLAIGAGCSESGPRLVQVQGMVTYRNKPVTQGTVQFIPKSTGTEMSRPASGTIAQNGSFEMQALPNRKGVLPGKYDVVVKSYTGSFIDGNVSYLVPERFANPATSGLSVDLSSSNEPSIVKDFDLKD